MHVIVTVIVVVVVGVTWVPVIIVVVLCNITDTVIRLDLMDLTMHPDQEVHTHYDGETSQTYCLDHTSVVKRLPV